MFSLFEHVQPNLDHSKESLLSAGPHFESLTNCESQSAVTSWSWLTMSLFKSSLFGASIGWSGVMGSVSRQVAASLQTEDETGTRFWKRYALKS
jgi:hypothetical protein